jgi:hypothetical protein
MRMQRLLGDGDHSKLLGLPFHGSVTSGSNFTRVLILLLVLVRVCTYFCPFICAFRRAGMVYASLFYPRTVLAILKPAFCDAQFS